MRDEQVDTAHGQPVRVPLDVPAGELPRIVVLVAGSKALVGIAAAVHQAGRIRAALTQRGIQPHKAVLFRCDPAQAQVLTGDAEVFFHLNIIALVGVSHQADAVLLAPAGKSRIVNAALPVKDHLMIEPGVGIFGFLEQCGQVFQLAACFGEKLGKALCPREHIPHVPPQNTGFIGEEADDGIPEVFFQFTVVGIVGQADEPLHDLRVQDVGTFRGVRFAIVFAPVDAADGAAALAHHQNALRCLCKDFISRLALAHQRDALTDQIGSARSDHAVCGAGRVHSLIVQNDRHVQRSSFLDRRADVGKVFFGKVFDAFCKADAGMQHHAGYAVCVEIIQLAADLVMDQVAIQKPERDRGKFARGFGKQCE